MSRELLAHPDWEHARHVVAARAWAAAARRCSPTSSRRSTSRWRAARRPPATGSPRPTASSPPTAPASTSPSRRRAGRWCRRSTPSSSTTTATTCRAGPDTVGELCVRGPVVIKGYLNRPEATAEAIRDGWFHTGDIARIDEDGFVFIVDRAKDMVLRGGENVYCSRGRGGDLRARRRRRGGRVRRPRRAPRRGRRRGRRAARPGSTLDADELRAFLDGRIAKHKIPARDLVPRRASCRATPTASSSSASCAPSSSAPDRIPELFTHADRNDRIREEFGIPATQVAVSASRRSRAWSTSWSSWATDARRCRRTCARCAGSGRSAPRPARRRGRRRSRAGGPRAASGRRARRTSGAGRG